MQIKEGLERKTYLGRRVHSVCQLKFFQFEIRRGDKRGNIFAVRENNYLRLMCNISKSNGNDN